MNVTLVQLYSRLQAPNAEPLAIEALSSALSHLPVVVELECLDPRYEGCRGELLSKLVSSRPEIVGVSVPQGTGALCEQLVLEARGVGVDTLWVFGHALPTADPKRFLSLAERCEVVRGWGEDQLVQIVESLLRRQPPELVIRPSSNDHLAPSSVLPCRSPARTWSGEYYRRVEGSRGCSYGHCTFCVRPFGTRANWETVPPSQVFEDVEDLYLHGIRRFTFTDEDFLGVDPEHARQIAEMLAALPGIEFTASVRAESLVSVDEQLLATLRLAGLSQVFIGVESLSASQLKRYGKGSSPSENMAAVARALGAGLRVEVGFIPFDPWVSPAELVESIGNGLESGFWKYAGTPFGRMRIEIGSPFSRLPKFRAESWDSETLEYAWRFDNDRIARVFEMADAWWGPVDYAYLLARNLVRTGDFRSGGLHGISGALADLRRVAWRGLHELALLANDGDCLPGSFWSVVDRTEFRELWELVDRECQRLCAGPECEREIRRILVDFGGRAGG